MSLRHRRYYFMEDAGLEFRDAGRSPLPYNRSGIGGVKRLVVCDPRVVDPPKKSDTYFATIERSVYFSPKTGKRYKNPRKETDPGVGDNCIVAFLDWHDEGYGTYYLDYVKVRQEFSGKKLARALIEYFYAHAKDAKRIRWGKMMQPQIGHLFQSMKDKYPNIGSSGHVFY